MERIWWSFGGHSVVEGQEGWTGAEDLVVIP